MSTVSLGLQGWTHTTDLFGSKLVQTCINQESMPSESLKSVVFKQRADSRKCQAVWYETCPEEELKTLQVVVHSTAKIDGNNKGTDV